MTLDKIKMVIIENTPRRQF